MFRHYIYCIWEEKNYTGLKMNSERKEELEMLDTTSDINHQSKNAGCESIEKKWKRNCPKCNSQLIYKGRKAKSNYLRSIRNNTCCYNCSHNVIPSDKLIRNCPKCNVELKYKFRGSYTKACILYKKCKKCSHRNNEFYGPHIRNCPSCNRQIIYKTKNSYKIAVNKNSHCRSCVSKNISEHTREKHRIAMTGDRNPFRNKAGHWKGKSRPDEFKRQHRILMLERLEKLKIPPTEDANSKEYFNKLNNMGFNFNPTRFIEIGYIADGYDKEKHIWYEYDTPYHLKPSQQKDDLIRQNNIIKYFKSINNPLKKFIRVQVDKDGNILDEKHIIY